MIRYGSIEILALVTDPSPGRIPLAPVYLTLSPGLTVLYGLNGAGKSLILDALEEVLTGKRGARTTSMHAMLYVRAQDSAVDFSADMEDLSVCGTASGLYEELSPRNDSLLDLGRWSDPDDKYSLPGALLQLRSFTSERFEWIGGFPESMDIDQILIDILRQKRFLIGATGRGGTAKWNLDPALVREANLNEVNEMLDMSDQGVRKIAACTEMAVQRVALPSGSDLELQDSYQALYKLDVGSTWKTGNFRFRVMGQLHFDPDRATRQSLDSYESSNYFLWTALENNYSDGFPPGFMEQGVWFFEEDVAAGRGEMPGLAPLQSGEWIRVADGELASDSGMTWFAEFISWRANLYYSLLLPDAPILQFQLNSPQDWVAGQLPQWGVIRSGWIPLESLSSAERRWAFIAIELAIERGPGGFLLIDEPETALHRSAERQMAKGLVQIAKDRDLAVIVATHSPELIDAPDVNVHLVRRSDQGLLEGHQLHQLLSSSKIDLQEFGLLPSDLLRRQRAFLLVEGQHDLVILESLVGTELERLRVELLPLRGAGRLASTLDSRVLYDFTDAHLFVLIDALRSDGITAIWQYSVQMAKTGPLSDAIVHLDSHLRALKIDEANALAAFATRALERGMDARHTPLSLSAPDILDYLPVNEFVANAESWESLRDELNRSSGSIQSGSKFKTWLVNSKNADLSPEHIREICQSLDYIPAEFTRILNAIEQQLQAI